MNKALEGYCHRRCMQDGRNKMPTEKESLDYFGQFLMKNYRDKALKALEIAITNKWKSKSFKEFQDFLQTSDPS